MIHFLAQKPIKFGRLSTLLARARDEAKRYKSRLAVIALLLLAAMGTFAAGGGILIPQYATFPDASGFLATVNQGGPTVQASNPFFQDLGTNGRRCVTCHEPGDAMSITPPHVRQRFNSTQGMDPLFRPVDGANCPTADVSTLDGRRNAYSLLLTKGLIRIGIGVPANADYQVISVYN